MVALSAKEKTFWGVLLVILTFYTYTYIIPGAAVTLRHFEHRGPPYPC